MLIPSPADVDQTPGQRRIKAVSYGLTLALLAYFVGAYLRAARMAPFMDDWTYVQVLEIDWGARLQWLIAEHVDHRIPLQKALQLIVLRLGGFDFRYLVALNMLLCAVLALVLTETARMVRGSRAIGDWIIPLLLLSPCTGPSLWGFQFQFLSSVFLLGVEVFALVSYVRTQRYGWIGLFFAACAMSTLCGINGLLCSTVLLGASLVLQWLLRAQLPAPRRWMLACAGLVALLCAVVWLTWKPSQASHVNVGSSEFLEYAFGMYGSPLGIYSFKERELKSALVLLVAVLALLLPAVSLLRRKADPARMAMAAMVTTTVLLGLSIAAGRAQAQGGWNPINGMHYSFLMMPVLLGGWVVLSTYLRPKAVRGGVGVALVLIVTAAYLTNAKWRYEDFDAEAPVRAQLAKDLRAGLPSADIASRYVSEMSSVPSRQAEIQHGIDVLRQRGYKRYGASAP